MTTKNPTQQQMMTYIQGDKDNRYQTELGAMSPDDAKTAFNDLDGPLTETQLDEMNKSKSGSQTPQRNFNGLQSKVGDNDEPRNTLDTVVSRNWFLLFHFTMLGAFIGLIVYIISGNSDVIWYLGGTFCAIAFGIDLATPKKYKTTTFWSKRKGNHHLEPKWDIDDPIEFPLRSNFVDEIGRPSGSCIIYESGKSPVERQRNDGRGRGHGRDDVVLTSNKDTLDDGNFEAEMKISGLSYGLKAAQQKPSNNSKFEQNSDLLSAVSNMGDYRALIIRQREINDQAEYRGYETGSGIGGGIGTVISAIGTFLRYYRNALNIIPDDWFDTSSTQILTWIVLIIFVLFLTCLIGGMAELELRRMNYLHPIGWSHEELKWFPLYEVVDWSYTSLGFYTINNTNDPKGCCSKTAYRWFRVLQGLIALVIKSFLVLFYVLFRNPAFGYWVFVTLGMGCTYYAHVDKIPGALNPGFIFCVIAFLISLILLFGTTKGSSKELKCCGCCSCCSCSKEVSTISENRIDARMQRKCFWSFCVSGILVLIAAILLFGVIVNYNDVDIESESDVWKNTNCVDYFEEERRRRMVELEDEDEYEFEGLAVDASSRRLLNDDEYPLCAEYGAMVPAVICLSVAWCILWISSLVWYFVDNSRWDMEVKQPENMVWRQFAKFRIRRRIYGELKQTPFSSSWSGSWFVWLFGGSKYKNEYIIVDIDTAIKLNKYLLNVTRMQRFNESILINPWLPYILPTTGAPEAVPLVDTMIPTALGVGGARKNAH